MSQAVGADNDCLLLVIKNVGALAASASMSHRLVEMVWSESKPRVLPLLLSLVYALVARLNVDAWREQDQFFVERDPQLAYPAHPSTVSNTHLVLTGCVLPFVLIFGLAAWAHARGAGRGGGVVDAPELRPGERAARRDGDIQRGKAFVGRLRPNFSPPATTRATPRRWPSSRRWARAALCSRHTSRPRSRAPSATARSAAPPPPRRTRRRSFPSGHAAIAFAGMTRLAAAVVGAGWLAGPKRRAFRFASHGRRRATRRGGCAFRADRGEAREMRRRRRLLADAVVAGGFAPRDAWYLHAAAAFPAAYACYVAASRIVDYKHRPADVVAGALVGLAAAAACDGGVSGGASVLGGRAQTRRRRIGARGRDAAHLSRTRRLAHLDDVVAGHKHSRATFSSLSGVFDENARYTSTAV